MRPILLTKRNFSERICREKLFLLIISNLKESVVCEKIWKNTLQTDTEHMIYYGKCALHAS